MQRGREAESIVLEPFSQRAKFSPQPNFGRPPGRPFLLEKIMQTTIANWIHEFCSPTHFDIKDEEIEEFYKKGSILLGSAKKEE